jgi:hypothetical protein
MMDQKKSPQITRISWGRIEVEGGRTFKDAKLFPGGCRSWNWNETGTGHSPGIQPADVMELLDHGCSEVILSRGVLGRLMVQPATISLLEERQVKVHVLRTREAVQLYNKLCLSQPVGALIHSTC